MVWTRAEGLKRRHQRVRRKIAGTGERPRLCIHKSLRHLYVQVIDDTAARTLCQATTNTKANRDAGKSFCNMANASRLGEQIAQMARQQGVEHVVFDRGGARYHGIVKAFGEAARKAGLKF